MSDGIYVVFEGIEGSGKSTTMRNVSHLLAEKQIKHITTRHPGSTPLGAHLRQITKYPEKIDPRIELDSLSAQLLMVVDAINFNKTLLKPSLADGTIVLADRCNPISMLAYGLADSPSLSYLQIDKLLNIIEPIKPDKLYIMDCDADVAYDRMRAQGGGDKAGLDRFERKGIDFQKRLYHIYTSLTTGDPALVMLARQCVNFQSVVYIDSTQEPEAVAQQIVTDIERTIRLLNRARGG